MIVIIILILILFSVWSFNMLKGNLKVIDDKVYNFLKFKDFYTLTLKILTTLASVKYFVGLAFLLLIFLSDKKLLGMIIIFLVFDSLLIESLKRIFKRERPNIKKLVKEKGYSYPSGHSVSATAFYGFLIYLTSFSSLNIEIKIILIILLLILIFAIAFSRIYLGVHYFSDVVGGFLLGSLYVSLYVYLLPIIINFISML